MAAIISLKSCCYICHRPFAESKKLRNHLFTLHSVDVEPRPHGKSRYNTEHYVYVKKNSDASHSMILEHFECPSCLNHYATMNELKDHI
ncbi:hypothetical protein BDB00DRAFT_750891, partial [Zychaea mexicana]|uniref:uncharacterized protein n=1 Tax=Zychaea mexicana TaxID=64656 RepID=UPI0022FE0A67